MECCYEQMGMRIFNVYASNLDKERKVFLSELKKWCTVNTVIMGDFNIVQSRMDMSINNVFKPDVSRRELCSFILENDMCDVWRASNPNGRVFSRCQVVQNVLKQTRIDLFGNI